jgi:hypothetical protein
MTRSWSVMAAVVCGMALVTGTIGRAAQETQNFAGLINDHTTLGAGAWEIHGSWALHLKGQSGKADFDAALTMERSDYWFVVTPGADPNSVPSRNPHTHHIAVVDGAVTPIAGGFRVTGPAVITGNGATPPFGPSSAVIVDVTGADLVPFSNITVTFTGDAAKHFGTQPVSGVVRSAD